MELWEEMEMEEEKISSREGRGVSGSREGEALLVNPLYRAGPLKCCSSCISAPVRCSMCSLERESIIGREEGFAREG